jgi:YggT family protein
MGFVAFLINSILGIIQGAIFIRVIASWLPQPSNQFLIQLLNVVNRITEPLLAPIRNMIEKFSNGRSLMIDLSPLILLFLIQLLRSSLLYM